MFIRTIKVKKPNVLAVCTVIIIVCIIAVLGVIACKFTKTTVYEMNSETQRQQFLSEMGWEASDEYDECKVVIIPDEFNDVYTTYNNLQKKQGFDLCDYKGKSVEVYTYSIKNYPDETTNVICNLMVYEGQLIGGDVCSTELNGFMQGLKRQ